MNSANEKKPRAKGTKDILSPDEFLPRNVKERITTMIDQDVLDEIRAQAAKQGVGYQTLLNHALRSYFLGGEVAAASYEQLAGAVEILTKRMDEFERLRKKKA